MLAEYSLHKLRIPDRGPENRCRADDTSVAVARDLPAEGCLVSLVHVCILLIAHPNPPIYAYGNFIYRELLYLLPLNFAVYN